MDQIECLDFYPLSHPAPTIVQCNAEVKYILVVRVFRKSSHSSYLPMHASISEYFLAFFSRIFSNLLKFLVPQLLNLYQQAHATVYIWYVTNSPFGILSQKQPALANNFHKRSQNHAAGARCNIHGVWTPNESFLKISQIVWPIGQIG